MQIKFKGQYTRKLFFSAVRLANQSGRTAQVMHIFVGLVFAVLTVITVQDLIATQDWVGNIISLALLSLMGIVLYQAYVPPYLGARRMWTESVQRPLRGAVTKDGVTYHFAQGSKVYPWTEINRRRTTKGLVTLVTLTGMLLVFPRYFFHSDADWERFKKLVETRVIVSKRR